MGDMTTHKNKFPVPDFVIRGGVLKQSQREALVQSAMAKRAAAKKAARAAGKDVQKGK